MKRRRLSVSVKVNLFSDQLFSCHTGIAQRLNFISTVALLHCLLHGAQKARQLDINVWDEQWWRGRPGNTGWGWVERI